LLIQIKEPTPQPQPPTAVISDPGSDLLVGQAVDFSGSGSNDSDGAIVRHEWSFGDGSTGTGEHISHVYSAAGSYTVSLTVTDNSGLTAKTTLLIQIKEPAPQQEPPTAIISDPGSKLMVGQAIHFSGSSSNDSDGVIVSYDWNFGDGNTGTGENVSYVYSTAGSYTVSLTVTDNSNLMATATLLIQINEPVEASNLE
jgi:PKD repeat protein